MGAVRAPGASQRLDRCLRVFRHHSDRPTRLTLRVPQRSGGPRPQPALTAVQRRGRANREGQWRAFIVYLALGGRPPARTPGPLRVSGRRSRSHGHAPGSEESASRERSAATRARTGRTLKKLIQPCALPPTVTVPHLPSRPTLGIHQRSEFCEKGRLRASRRAAARSRGDRPQTRRSDVHYRQISTTVQDEDVADGRRRSCWMSHATAVCCACALAPLEAMAWPSPGKLTARTSGHLPSCWSAATH